MRVVAPLLGSMLAVALCTGCVSSEPESAPPGYVIESGALGAIRDATSSFQSGLLSDGVLTFEEYERAIFAQVACFRDNGFEPEHLTLDRRQQYRWRVVVGDDDAWRTWEPVLRECSEQYSEDVELLWQMYTAPTEEELQEAREALVSCLEARGRTVLDGSTEATLLDLGQANDSDYSACAAEVQEQFALPGFGG